MTKPLAQAAVLVVLLPTLWLLGRSFDRDQLLNGFGPAAALPGWVQAVVVVIMGDFIGYWMHRAFHSNRLWRFHAVHHGARELTWMSAVRVHPVNDVVTRMVQAVPFVALGFSPLMIGGYLPFLTFYAIMLHANLRWDFGPLRYVLASPTFHRRHHADDPDARDKNFAGLLPLWDWMFGTLYMPLGKVPQSFGAQGEAVPVGLLAQMIYPFRRRPIARPRRALFPEVPDNRCACSGELRITWTSKQDHLGRFRGSEEFKGFLATIKPYVPSIEEMRHYEPSDVQWTR